MAALRLWLVLILLGGARLAWAQAPDDDVQRAQVDALRAEVAAQLQLQAFDLLDELIYAWQETPLFANETPVVLGGVSVPTGLGTALSALLENHLVALLTKNPRTKLALTHCPQCSALLVHSGKNGTVVARGVDAPEALLAAGGLSGSKHVLFVDFEAEGASLVLRARLTKLTPELPIVAAKTLSSSGSSAALLREGESLKSASAARAEYLDVLQNRGILVVPLKLVVRSYADPEGGMFGGANIAVAPFIWLQAGVELGLSQARAWTASFQLGYTWSPETHDGWLAQARISRLVSGSTWSLTQPDVYLFLGGAAITISGADALMFRNSTPRVADILESATGKEPRSTFAAWHLGLEMRLKNRIGLSVFLESMPALADAPGMSNYIDIEILPIQGMGAEVSFCF